MKGNSTINAIINGQIVYEVIHVNFDHTKKYVVFSFKKTNDISTLSYPNLLSEYIFSIQCVSPVITDVLTLTDMINAYLLNYKDASLGFQNSLDDETTYDPDEKVWFKTTNYDLMANN